MQVAVVHYVYRQFRRNMNYNHVSINCEYLH
jgi:hypothetical protein